MKMGEKEKRKKRKSKTKKHTSLSGGVLFILKSINFMISLNVSILGDKTITPEFKIRPFDIER